MSIKLPTHRLQLGQHLLRVLVLLVALVNALPRSCAPFASAQPPLFTEQATRLAQPASEPAAELDTIASLGAQGNLDQAEILAQQQFDAAELSTDEAARAAVALSSVRIAKLLRAPLTAQNAHLDAAREPLQRVLRAYPDHRRALWLRYQHAAGELAVAQRQAAVQAVTAGDERQRLAVLATLIECGRELQVLEQQAAEQIAVAFDQRDRSPWIDELMALRNAIAVKRVEVLLRRGELFAVGSDDALAAAAEAQQAAIAALALLRDAPLQRAALIRMRCEALLQMGQAEQAETLLQPLLTASEGESGAAARTPTAGRPDDPTLALAVRVALELNQLPQAERWLAGHYGDNPAKAAAAPESDLARLRYLIAAGAQNINSPEHQQELGNWLEAIRQRGGDFAQRRAEAILVERLGRSAVLLSDPRIVLAKAAAELRAGKALEAAQRLSNAARQITEPSSARRLAIAGAAAFSSAGDHRSAVILLRDIALSQTREPEAAALQLQAAVLLDQQLRSTPSATSDTDIAQVDQLLRQTVQLWPGNPVAEQARDWLIKRLRAANQLVEAAIAASPSEATAATDQQWNTAALLWAEALAMHPLVTPDLTLNPEVEPRLSEALRHLPADIPAAVQGRQRLIALFGSAELATTIEPAASDEAFIRWLLEVRRGHLPALPTLDAIEQQTLEAAAQRLIADGIAAPNHRVQLATVVRQLEGDRTTLTTAIALIWLDQWREADNVLDAWVQQSTPPARNAASINAARILSHSPQADAKRRALDRFAGIGATLPQGSDPWHQVKLATLELLSDLDQRAEAARLAQYILLTRPPADAVVKARYQSWSEP